MPKTPLPEDNRSIPQILAGIQLVLGELRDMKQETAENHKRADEERKRADEDRKQYAEDRRRSDARFETIIQAFSDRFDSYARQHLKRDRELHMAMKVIGRVGERLIETQAVHTRLLQQILHAVQGRTNGHARGNGKGNGRSAGS